MWFAGLVAIFAVFGLLAVALSLVVGFVLGSLSSASRPIPPSHRETAAFVVSGVILLAGLGAVLYLLTVSTFLDRSPSGR